MSGYELVRRPPSPLGTPGRAVVQYAYPVAAGVAYNVGGRLVDQAGRYIANTANEYVGNMARSAYNAMRERGSTFGTTTGRLRRRRRIRDFFTSGKFI